jgi:hypothetical protein
MSYPSFLLMVLSVLISPKVSFSIESSDPSCPNLSGTYVFNGPESNDCRNPDGLRIYSPIPLSEMVSAAQKSFSGEFTVKQKPGDCSKIFLSYLKPRVIDVTGGAYDVKEVTSVIDEEVSLKGFRFQQNEGIRKTTERFRSGEIIGVPEIIPYKGYLKKTETLSGGASEDNLRIQVSSVDFTVYGFVVPWRSTTDFECAFKRVAK